MQKNNRTKYLTTMALLATISLVLTRFFSFYIPFMGAQSMRVGFGTVPVILAGLLLGAPAGGFVGLASDLVGATLFPSGPFFPGFTLSAFLAGFIPAFLIRLFNKKEQRLGKPLLFVCILCSQIISSAVLTTLWIVVLYMSPFSLDKFWALLSVRAPFALMMSIVYTVIIYPLFMRVSKEFI
ncbi:MAG: folate family ECF transporter S component [Clostridia bacterium]|nr:folate family ECF transporter S component [Clostridia bacterium]